MNNKSLNNRIGLKAINKEGNVMKIIKYNNCGDIVVQFEDGFAKVHTKYCHFKSSSVKNPFHKNVHGIGYIGVGDFKARLNGVKTNSYSVWQGMIQRCYSEKSLIKRPTYKSVTVCDEWHNFQNFAEWYEKNYYEVDNERMDLDKDILFKGNQVYSPDTCVFVASDINKLFLKREAKRGDLPIGVAYNKTSKINPFQSRCKNLFSGKLKYLGVFKTQEEAFEAYKKYKETHIKEVAEHYKDKLPKRLYDAMYNWIVEITD